MGTTNGNKNGAHDRKYTVSSYDLSNKEVTPALAAGRLASSGEGLGLSFTVF